jgi:cell division protein FtsQ
MRREMKILVATLALAGLWAGGTRAPEALASMETFKVREIEVRGLRYLEEEEAVGLLAVDPLTSVWADLEVNSDRLRAHALVESVRITRRIPGTLVVHVTERIPVALVPTPTLEPVDAEGVRLPIDPAEHRLDLPVLELSEVLREGASVLPDRARRLAAEVGRLQQADTAFLQRVSEVRWQKDDAVLARWSEPRVAFLLWPGTSPGRLRQGLAVLGDALARNPNVMPSLVDLRYADQVVVRRSPSHGMNDAR